MIIKYVLPTLLSASFLIAGASNAGEQTKAHGQANSAYKKILKLSLILSNMTIAKGQEGFLGERPQQLFIAPELNLTQSAPLVNFNETTTSKKSNLRAGLDTTTTGNYNPNSNSDKKKENHNSRKLNVFLPDERTLVYDTYEYPQRTVGLLSLPSGLCTASLIGSDIILTNKHCVDFSWDNKVSQSFWDNGEFLLGYANGSYIASSKFHYVLWFYNYDVAIIQLKKPLGDKHGYLGLEDISLERFRNFEYQVNMIGYSGDYLRSYGLAGKQLGCSTRGTFESSDEPSVLHDCDATAGSSGSSLYRTKNFGLANVVALHYAAFQPLPSSGSLPLSSYSKTYSNLAVASSVFYDAALEARNWPPADDDSDDNGTNSDGETCLSKSSLIKVKLNDESEIMKEAGELKSGDMIQTAWDQEGNAIYSPIKYISHESAKSAEFYQLSLANGNTITATPKHRVFYSEVQGEQSKIYDATLQYLVERLKSGQEVFLISEGKKIKVETSAELNEAGFINPITQQGTIVVFNPNKNLIGSGTLVSCYSVVPHAIAHLAYKIHYSIKGDNTVDDENGLKLWEQIAEKIASKTMSLSN